jgi:hypothetical protein
MTERKALFISHASPEGNPFAIWLGAKLAALGYEVWADVLRLAGGDDWERKLETAIRDRACKVLLAANPVSVDRQGVRNEIHIATEVGKKICDKEFIIPLRLARFEAPFLIAHAQYIDFEQSWAVGLQQLLKELDEVYKVLPSGSVDLSLWTNLQLIHGKPVVEQEEALVSNWLGVRKLPKMLYYLPPTAAKIHGASLCNYPKVPYGDGWLSAENIGSRDQLQIEADLFLERGWPRVGAGGEEARRLFAALANQALGRLFEAKGLARYEMANRQINWWVGKAGPAGRTSFGWPNISGSRQLQGHSSKRKVFWHYGVSTAFRGRPFPHVQIKSRLLFSEDGLTPIDQPKRMQRLRKSFAKSWRNARWRDMMLAFLSWISDGVTILEVPCSTDQNIVLSLPPLLFTSPVRVSDAGAADYDSDDPDIEFVRDEDSLENEEDDDESEGESA